jgi:hypothetical protein
MAVFIPARRVLITSLLAMLGVIGRVVQGLIVPPSLDINNILALSDLAHRHIIGTHIASTAISAGPHVPGLAQDILAPTMTHLTQEVTEGFGKLLVDDVKGTYEAIRKVVVPTHVENTIAGILAESTAGAVGGIISRGAATALGDFKRDSLRTKLRSTASFFGVQQVALSGKNHLIYTSALHALDER